ncbi:DUF5696 domain-containing protein [Anaeromicropila populeti]|uniref:Uncharacterized protein n=1 Tax=Anaeromicropila populeti TaxID=37658 RepID=A0A1I6LK18_9FIRM|nr:DUF5696 domain-containing protein [Anaeromicropila populeti]SFS03763.1 hypothetical protein SAMN05661086_03339 [Anaeromicropila populeti]
MKKKYLLPVILTALVLVGTYVAYLAFHFYLFDDYKKLLVNYSYEEGTEFVALQDSAHYVQGMDLVAENDTLMLYANLETTEVAVYDKRNGQITYSNPVDRESDEIATGVNKNLLGSQIVVDYFDSGLTLASMNNYEKSILKNQFTIERIENGIRFTYLLGDLENELGIVPPVISQERLTTLVLDHVTEKQARTVKASYQDMKDKEGFLELAKGTRASKVGMKKLKAIFEEAGYTQEDCDEDAAAASGQEVKEKVTFTIPLEYRLIDDKLEVNIPTEKVKETGNAQIAAMKVLSYFGAGASDEEGYMFVPNGSGSLINFNNGKKTEQYNAYVYGMDIVSQSLVSVENTEKIRLPIYGIKKENNAIFARITSGESVASITADVSGKLNSYNYVYPTFVIRGSDVASMFGATGAGADMPIAEKNFYKLNLTIQYAFLDTDEASYSGMANYFRNELLIEGTLTKLEESSSIPLYVDVVGGVQQQADVLGIPYYASYPLTTFDEAGEIVDALNDENISNIKMNYLGWFNRGYYHDVPDKIKVISKLGGKKDLESLSQKLEEQGGALFGDVAFQRVSFSSKRFNYKMESSRYYAGSIVTGGRKNPVTMSQVSSVGGYMETLNDALSPKFLVRYVDKFSDKIDKIDITGISLRDMADDLHADRKRTEIINREESKYIVQSSIAQLEETGKEIMVNGGDFYSLAYVDDIVNMPLTNNEFYIVDEEIPFYQMVVHGCINYTGTALNLDGNLQSTEALAKLIEAGASPRYTLSYKDSSKIKYSGLASLYSTQYEEWMEDLSSTYSTINEVLAKVSNSFMIEHEIIEGVRKITYDNGIVIYVNLTNEDARVDNVLVSANGYAMKGGAE